MGYQLLDRMSYKRFPGLASATGISDRTAVLTYENRIGDVGAKTLFDDVLAQLLNKGFIERGGQIIDATLVLAPRRYNSCGEKGLSECQERRNHRIAKTRARVEHVVAAVEQMGGKSIRAIGQARARFEMTAMVACYNQPRLIYFHKVGFKTF